MHVSGKVKYKSCSVFKKKSLSRLSLISTTKYPANPEVEIPIIRSYQIWPAQLVLFHFIYLTGKTSFINHVGQPSLLLGR